MLISSFVGGESHYTELCSRQRDTEIIHYHADGRKRAFSASLHGADWKDLWYDREHPAEGGYRLWAKALMPYLRH